MRQLAYKVVRACVRACVRGHVVEPDHNDTGLYDTLRITSSIVWYQLQWNL
jgi:hypothetical protein